MLYVSHFEGSLTKSYTQASLNWIKALQTQNINFEVIPVGGVLNWSSTPLWAQSSQKYFVGCQSNRECAVIHALPTDLLTIPYKSQDKAIGVTVFEADALPAWVTEGLNESYKGLIVPSQFTKSNLIRGGLTIPVEVVDHAIGDWWVKQYRTPEEKDPTRYVFGFVGYWNSRKYPMTLVKAYLEAFPNESDDFALLIKTFNAGDIEQKIKNLTGNSEVRSDIWIYDEEWTEEELLWGYGLIDCYVSAHKAEGFGLTLAQAALLGKPVIYTDYSAPTEWLKAPEHYPVRYDLCEVSDVTPAYANLHFDAPDLKWANPTFQHLVDQIKNVAHHKPQYGFEGDTLKAFQERLSWKVVGERFVEAIESIMDKSLERKENNDG